MKILVLTIALAFGHGLLAAEMRAPLILSEQLDDPDYHGKVVRTDGVIRRVLSREPRLQLLAQTRMRQYGVVVEDAHDIDVEALVGGLIRFTGVVEPLRAPNSDVVGAQIIVADAAGIERLRSSEDQSDGLLAMMSRKNLVGTVTLAREKDRFIFLELEDGSTARCDVDSGFEGLRAGDRVAVQAFLANGSTTRRFEDAIVRRLSSGGKLPPPTPLTLEDAQQLYATDGSGRMTDRFGQRAVLEGEIRDILVRAHKVDVTIAQNDYRAIFSFYHDGKALPEGVENGAWVRVTGVLSMFYNLPFYNRDGRFSLNNFRLNLQSPDDIEIVRRAPWWTPFRLTMVIVSALVLLCLGFGWNLYLRRRMRIQAERLVATMREKQRERIEAEASRRERLNLAHDLHDGFQQLLAGTMFRLEAGLNYVEEDPAQARSQIEKARTSLEHTQNGLRAALWGMVEESEGPKTLSGLFRFAASRLPQWQGKVAFEFSGEEPRLARKVSGGLLLILQEAIGNALKHGRAEHVVVSTTYQPDGEIVLVIRDDGCGFAMDASRDAASHLGIQSMRDRAARLGGSCTVESSVGAGTRVEVKVRIGES